MPDAPKKRILYMEDDALFGQFLTRKLEAAGYTVTMAGDGEEGLAKLQEGSYNLVLTDLMMPKVDGYDVLAKRQGDEKMRRVPMLVLSSLESAEDRKKAADLGATEYLIKDESQREIMDAVKRHLPMASASV